MGSIMGDFIPSSHDLTDNTTYTMGTRFHPVQPLLMTHFRWWVPAVAQAGDAPVVFALWDNWTQEILFQQTFDTGGFEDQRIEVALDDGPYELTETLGSSGYTVSVTIPSRYVATSGFVWSSAGDPDDLVCPQPAGFFAASGSPTFPTSGFGSANYFADLVYELPEEPPDGPTLTIWDGSVEQPVTMKLWNGTAEVAVSIDGVV